LVKLGEFIVSSNNYGNVANGNGNVQNLTVQGSYNSYDSQKRNSLSEVVAEIQRLLRQLEETNPMATESEQISYVNVATKPHLKQRAISALKEGSDTAIDEFVLENKYLKVVKAVAKGWLTPSI
jgi:hypothetical protein